MSIESRIVNAYLSKQAREDQSKAEGILYRNEAPDDRPWHVDTGVSNGKPMKPSFSVSGLEFNVRSQKELSDGNILFSVDVSSHSDADGVYLQSYLFIRYIQAGYSEGVLLNVAEKYLKSFMVKMKDMIKDRMEWPGPEWLMYIVDDFREWEVPSVIKASDVWIRGTPHLERDYLSFGWGCRLEIVTKLKAPLVGAGVFAEMSDSDLNKWLSKWESYAPEDFWQDGELRVSKPEAYRMYRDWLRELPIRDQKDRLEAMKQY